MGNRCVTIFVSNVGKNLEISPAVYQHWAGDKTDIINDIEAVKALMGARTGDVSYTCARYIGILHAKDPNSNLSLGVYNTNPEDYIAERNDNAIFTQTSYAWGKLSHGDEGVFVVNTDDFTYQHFM
jgi:hypothetical protein